MNELYKPYLNSLAARGYLYRMEEDLCPTADRPPFKVVVCSSILSLVGISFFVSGIILFGDPPSVSLIFLPAYSILIGVLSVVAAIGYWRLKSWGVYVHLLSLVQQLLLIPFLVYRGGGPIVWMGLILSFVIVVLMAVYLKIKLFIITIVIGFAITCASFAYQQMGPEIGVYGNMCDDQPHGYCYGRLLGAGLPMQYVLDQPGVSVMYELGVEDNFRIVPFLLDVLFYSAMIYGGIGIIRRYRLHKHNRVQRDVGPTLRAGDGVSDANR